MRFGAEHVALKPFLQRMLDEADSAEQEGEDDEDEDEGEDVIGPSRPFQKPSLPMSYQDYHMLCSAN